MINNNISQYKNNTNNKSFQLLETLLLEDGNYFILEKHLARLLSSAKYFNFNINETKIREKLTLYAKVNSSSKKRVRLLLNKNGDFQIEGAPFKSNEQNVRKAIVAHSPINKKNIFHYHKTTNRTIYAQHKLLLQNKYFDVLMWNEKKEITEFTIGNIVLERDGELYTPPVNCGLLPGTFREYLLERGKITEKIILLEELDQFSNIWLINSIRHWIPIKLIIKK